jgi:rhodanese-related sulfurtransferase
VQFLLDNMMLASLVVFSGLMLVWSFVGNKMRGLRDVETTGAMQLINHKNALVLDVREANEFKGGHILNAKHIPLGKLNSRLNEIESHRDQPIVVVCRSGNRSASACGLLKAQGFGQSYNLTGGMLAWQKANLPVTR